MRALLVRLPDVIVVGLGEWPEWLRVLGEAASHVSDETGAAHPKSRGET
jgi:hypothetical protein